MKSLNENWITEGLIDFEYKQYLLLAYLKTVKNSFFKNELYPFLSDLVNHYRNLKMIRESKINLIDSFPKELQIEGGTKLSIAYKNIIEDDKLMKEIESIVEFALPKIKGHLEEGTMIYDQVESNCEITPIGLSPLYLKEGYLFISQPPEKEANIYRYQITIFGDSGDSYRGIHTEFIFSSPVSITHTYEKIKIDLTRKFKDLPNPSTYLVNSKTKFPYDETLMPVAKRLLIRQLAA
ncbi:MAG: hypothetical protein HC811_02000 [Flammeovirgaceae bacterium]|nr:hypothetical protein [Flammeovirgaceae bacterium]